MSKTQPRASELVMWLMHMNDESLANRLRLIAENVRRFSPVERRALLIEAARRLDARNVPAPESVA